MSCDLQSHTLQAYLDQELQAQSAAQVEVHLERCPDCRQQLIDLEQEDVMLGQRLGVLTSPPVAIPDALMSLAQFESQFQTQFEPPQPRRWWMWPGWSFAAVGAFTLCLIAVSFPWMSSDSLQSHTAPPKAPPFQPTQPVPTPGHALHRKGDGMLLQMFHAHRQGKGSLKPHTTPRLTRDNQRLRPGDLIQFRYERPSGEPLHVMVVGVNQRKEIFAYVPLRGKHSIRLSQPRGRLPERALELDDVLGREVFLLITSSKPFSLKSVEYAIQRQWQKYRGELGAMRRLRSPFWQLKAILIRKQRAADAPLGRD